MHIAAILTGFCAGVLGGMVGIGGGIIMVPALAYFLKFNQHLSQGTTLAAMVPPIGILAALEYYRQGYVNIPVAGLLALGFLVGGFIGAKAVILVDDESLKRLFGIVLLFIALRMITGK